MHAGEDGPARLLGLERGKRVSGQTRVVTEREKAAEGEMAVMPLPASDAVFKEPVRQARGRYYKVGTRADKV